MKIDWDLLVQAAKKAWSNAYAPYSGFCVGAAVLTSSNKIFSGCNVENASYGLCMCAERVAIGNMIAAGERELQAIVVISGSSTPASPCGACRQVLAEFAMDVPVYLASTVPGSVHRVTSLSKLLPDAFRGEILTAKQPSKA